MTKSEDRVRDGRHLMEQDYARPPIIVFGRVIADADGTLIVRRPPLTFHPLAATSVFPAHAHDCGHVSALGWTWAGKDGPITVCNDCFKLLKATVV